MLNAVPPSPPVGSCVVWLVQSVDNCCHSAGSDTSGECIGICVFVVVVVGWLFPSFVWGRVFEGIFVLKQSWGDEQQSPDRTGGRHPTAALQNGGEGETGGKRGTCSACDVQRLDCQDTFQWLRFIKKLILRRNKATLSESCTFHSLLLESYLCVCDAAHRGWFTCLLTKSLCEVR